LLVTASSHFAFVAQLAEQGTLNPKVAGSIPAEGIHRTIASAGRISNQSLARTA
jgi:hypothetical protein